MLELQAIEAQVRDLARRIKVPPNYLPTFGYSDDNARPFIQVDQAYHYVVEERGEELRRDSTNNLDELLYWIFESITGTMSWDWELRHRREGEDLRRQGFAKKSELLAELSQDWVRRWQKEEQEILSKFPFHDR